MPTTQEIKTNLDYKTALALERFEADLEQMHFAPLTQDEKKMFNAAFAIGWNAKVQS